MSGVDDIAEIVITDDTDSVGGVVDVAEITVRDARGGTWEVATAAVISEQVVAETYVAVPGATGPAGPRGPAGLVKIEHGADTNVARPDVPLVYWVGSVKPVNADPDDLLMLKD